MSKISPSLKALINAPFARPNPVAAPAKMRELFQTIAREAGEREYGRRPWLTMSAAATFTLNSPESLSILHGVATTTTAAQQPKPAEASALDAAETIREVGLKCISFNGIPRSINCLGAFRASLPESLTARLAREPTRRIRERDAQVRVNQGVQLWESVYTPFETKLFDKLAESHPDLPGYIVDCHYGMLLADPLGPRNGLATVGRSLTSVVAIACLRAQTGVGPQVLSHVYGLRKAVEQGKHRDEFPEGPENDMPGEADAVERLATDEGCEWLLRSVDRIAEAIGSNFAAAPPTKERESARL